MTHKEVIISGGGTAGHLYPALAVGQKLKEQDPDLHLTFVGSSRSLERNIMKQYRANFIPLRIEGIKRKGLRIIKSLFLLPLSFFKSLAILIRMKPNLVIGVGGYSSGPIVLLASWMKIPTLILEQNLYPGFTNRLLLPWVKRAVVSFRNSLSSFKGKGIFIGNPVREEFYNLAPKQRSSKLTLLIFGGSQGSHFLNKAIVLTLPLIKRWNMPQGATLNTFSQAILDTKIIRSIPEKQKTGILVNIQKNVKRIIHGESEIPTNSQDAEHAAFLIKYLAKDSLFTKHFSELVDQFIK